MLASSPGGRLSIKQMKKHTFCPKAMQEQAFINLVKQVAGYTQAGGGTYRLKPEFWKDASSAFPYWSAEHAAVMRENKHLQGIGTDDNTRVGPSPPETSQAASPEVFEIGSEAEYASSVAGFASLHLLEYLKLDDFFKGVKAQAERKSQEYAASPGGHPKLQKQKEIATWCRDRGGTVQGELARFKEMHDKLEKWKARIRRYEARRVPT